MLLEVHSHPTNHKRKAQFPRQKTCDRHRAIIYTRSSARLNVKQFEKLSRRHAFARPLESLNSGLRQEAPPIPTKQELSLSYTSEGFSLGGVGKQVRPLRDDVDQLLQRRNHRLAPVLNLKFAVVSWISRCPDQYVSELQEQERHRENSRGGEEDLHAWPAAARRDTHEIEIKSRRGDEANHNDPRPRSLDGHRQCIGSRRCYPHVRHEKPVHGHLKKSRREKILRKMLNTSGH